MNRIIVLVIYLFCISPIWAQSANISKIESQLLRADSLFTMQDYGNVIQLLQPLAPAVKTIDNLDLKLNYYTLLSISYIHNKDFVRGVQYMEERSLYNNDDLEDLICAAIVSLKEIGDYNKLRRYARRALVKRYGNLTLENKVELNQVGWLLYLLGLSYVGLQDSFMAKECLSIHSSFNIEEQYGINQDLMEQISLINTTSSNPSQNLKELIPVDYLLEHSEQNIQNKQDLIEQINAIESVDLVDFKNLENYLSMVLSLDSIFKFNQDLYSSKRLLDTAIQNIIDANIRLSSRLGLQLMVRLGHVYSLFQDKEEALDWLFMVKKGWSNIGAFDETYVTMLQLIGNIYLEKDIFWSRLFIEEAIEIYEDIYGNIYEQGKSEAYSLLNSYADILQRCNRDDIAENIYRHILKECHDSNILFTLNNYGAMLYDQGRNTEAIYYCQQLNNMVLDFYNLTNIMFAYIDSGDYHNAELTFRQYVASMFVTTIDTWTKFTTYEIEDWWSQLILKFYMTINYIADKINSQQSLLYGFDATLFCKTFQSLYNSAMKACIAKSDNKDASNLKKMIQQYKCELIKPQDVESNRPYLLHRKIRQLEDSMKLNLPELSQRIVEEWMSFNDIVTALGKEEVAIEFFEYIDFFSDNHSIAAYVILPDSDAPIMVKISPFEPTTELIFNIISDETKLNSLYSEDNDTIYKMIWDKLIPYVQDKKTVYYATSGAISFINHDIVHDNTGQRLDERFHLHRVSTTSQIAIVKNATNINYCTAVLYGNIDYDTKPSLMTRLCNNEPESESDSEVLPNHIVISSEVMRSGWSNLPNTMHEIRAIKAVMDSVCINTKIFEKEEANEESFRRLDGESPDIIHVATHGFSAYKYKTYKDKAHISYTDYDQAMSFEGLLFSGANNILLGKQIPENIEDGVLTAEEISELDLSGTKLVVLSACETGTGNLNKIGRIIGLQEAFKNAGCQSILMSLWQVPDESTALLMTKFYEALFSGHNRHDALKIAMQKVREIYPDPYYWGAFVILD